MKYYLFIQKLFLGEKSYLIFNKAYGTHIYFFLKAYHSLDLGRPNSFRFLHSLSVSACPPRQLLASKLPFSLSKQLLNSLVSFYRQAPSSGKTKFPICYWRQNSWSPQGQRDVLPWEAIVVLHCLFIPQPQYKFDQCIHSGKLSNPIQNNFPSMT